MHTPVFLEQVLSALHIQEGDVIVDCTVGEGGHTDACMRAGARVIAIDADESQIIRLQTKWGERVGLTLHNGNYRDIKKIVKTYTKERVRAIIADLGLSYGQYMDGNKGFTYRDMHQPLDMNLSAKGATRAVDVCNRYDETQLARMLVCNSELAGAVMYANRIVQYRKKHTLHTVGDLCNALGTKTKRVLAQVFQSLRIEVNQEFEALQFLVSDAYELLAPGGLFIVISFHSLEDRYIKRLAKQRGYILLEKVVGRVASELTFERSALLRVYQTIL